MAKPEPSRGEVASAASGNQIRPLTGRDSDGNLYIRSNEVRSQIQNALDLDSESLVERACIRDYDTQEHLREECLIYLIREYALRSGPKSDRMSSRLAGELTGRVGKHLNSRLQGIENKEDRDDAFQSVVNKMFREICDFDSDDGDFLQVRFWTRLKRLAIDEFRKRSRLTKQKQSHDSLEEVARRREKDGSGEVSTNDSLTDRSATSPSDEVGWADIKAQVLADVEEPQRTAYILRHEEEWLIETKKENEPPTLSEYFDCTPRTIRRWLDSVEEKVESWKANHPQAEKSWKT